MMVRRLLHTPLALTLRRVALLYVVLMCCRAIFYLYNAAAIGTLAWSDAGELLRGALLFDTSSVVYADGIFILLALAPLPFRCRRWYQNMLYGYYTIVNAVLVVGLNLADAVYFRYTQKRLTAEELFFADNDNTLPLIGKFAAENWYLALAAVALVVVLSKGYGPRRCEKAWVPGPRWVAWAADTVVFALAAGLCVAGMRGGFTRATRPITLSNAMLYTSDSAVANMLLSNPFCVLRTVSGGSLRYEKPFAPDVLDALFSPVHRPEAAAKTGLEGRNVVVFIMESMSAEHSAFLMPEVYEGCGQQGFTPFLDSLMREGMVFRRMYANGTRSIQAMPAVLGSIPSFRTPFPLMPQSLGESRQLPAILRDAGYETLFFCGSERGSMGFGAYARSAGMDRIFSREDYEEAHGTGDFDGYWGIWDEPFLQYMGEELGRTPQPFFATLFTLSAHHPFVVPESVAESLPKGYTRIHRGVAYDDYAFRSFFRRFHREAWFRRTLFVFVADHVSSEKFADQTRTYPGNMRIMGFLYAPHSDLKGEVDSVTQQIDLMPTLLGLLGNREPYFAFGRDIFGEPDRPRWSVCYDGVFRALTDDAVISFETGEAAVSPRTDPAARPAADTTAADLPDRFRALVQQYYTRIERKRYTVHD